MFITEEDYKVVIGEQRIKGYLAGKPGKPYQCRSGSPGRNCRLSTAEIRLYGHFSLHRMNIGTASLSCTPATFHFTT